MIVIVKYTILAVYVNRMSSCRCESDCFLLISIWVMDNKLTINLNGIAIWRCEYTSCYDVNFFDVNALHHVNQFDVNLRSSLKLKWISSWWFISTIVNEIQTILIFWCEPNKPNPITPNLTCPTQYP